MSATETIQATLTEAELLEKCHQDGMDLGRKVLALLHGDTSPRSSYHFLTVEADCHKAQHQGFSEVLGLESPDNPLETRVVKSVGGLALVREPALGADVGPDGELTDVPLGWDYRILETEQAAISAE